LLATTTGCTPSTQVPSTTTSVTVSGLTPGATYHWQVRACADSGCTVFTDANGSGGHWSFTVASAPGAFGKSAPANGASGQPTNPTLSWGAASGVNHYRYCVATSSGCTPGTSVGTATSVELSGLAAGTTYYWQVRACADSGCTVFTDANGSGGHWSFTVAAAPGAFGKTAPTNGATGQPTNPTLSWGAASGVNHYRYCMATSSGCTPGTSVGTATSVGLSGLAAGTTYYWQVRACADSGCTVFTDANGSGGHWSFTVASAPGAFGKSAPANGASGQPTNPTLSWGAASGVDHYRYCVATSSGCTPGTSVGTATSVELSGLAAGTTYYWQVRACADSGCTVFTDANGSGGHWSFTVASAPGAFGKSAPANGATGQPTNPTLSWGAASGVNHYRYCVATSSGCTPGTSVGTATSVELSGLAAGTTYYWQVRACADSGCTVFTDANGSGGHWSFTVAAAPGAFGKTAPTNGATGQPTNPTLSWGAASGVNHYRYCVATSSGCTPGTSVGTATSVELSGLAAGTTYYWQVRACADSGCTVFTDANGSGGHWSFTVASAPGAFGKTAPTNGASGQPTNPTLSWGAASGVNHYRYCVATSSGCTPGTSVGTATSVELSGLAAGTTYYWQVRACADSGCTVFTDANGSGGHWSFTVASCAWGVREECADERGDGAADQPDAELGCGERGESLSLLRGDVEWVHAWDERWDGDQRRAERSGGWDDVLLAGARLHRQWLHGVHGCERERWALVVHHGDRTGELQQAQPAQRHKRAPSQPDAELAKRQRTGDGAV
jgi:uncharacterized membrane protein